MITPNSPILYHYNNPNNNPNNNPSDPRVLDLWNQRINGALIVRDRMARFRDYFRKLSLRLKNRKIQYKLKLKYKLKSLKSRRALKLRQSTQFRHSAARQQRDTQYFAPHHENPGIQHAFLAMTQNSIQSTIQPKTRPKISP